MATAVDTSLTGEEIVALCRKHTIFEWSIQPKVDPIPVARAEGVYFWTPEGKRYLDFNSQLMCTNIGHGHPKVVKAIQDQAATLAYANPFMATEPRARLGAKLAEITPGDIDTFFFTNGGAEAIENAIRVARVVTGRHKIMVRYRSYHGGTAGAIDPDRRSASLGLRARHSRASCASPTSTSGDARIPSRWTWPCATSRTSSATRVATRSRPSIVETVVGTNGILIPPDGYMQGLREICDKPRHPAHRRRGHGRLRPHRQVVRDRPLGSGSRPDDDGQGHHLGLRAARGGGDAAAASRASSRRRRSRAASPTTATPWPAPRPWPRSRCTRKKA